MAIDVGHHMANIHFYRDSSDYKSKKIEMINFDDNCDLDFTKEKSHYIICQSNDRGLKPTNQLRIMLLTAIGNYLMDNTIYGTD